MFLRSEVDCATVVLVVGRDERGVVKDHRVLPPISIDQPVWSSRPQHRRRPGPAVPTPHPLFSAVAMSALLGHNYGG